jgi:dUTP pyrophosphatase
MELDIELRVQKLRPEAFLPARATQDSIGFDLCACLEAPLTVGPKPQLVPAGIAIEAPPGVDMQVRPRSSLSLKGVGVAFGTIDPDYRGEVFVTMWTFGGLDAYELEHGDRIAQLVIARSVPARIVEADALSETARGVGGHGSTGR